MKRETYFSCIVPITLCIFIMIFVAIIYARGSHFEKRIIYNHMVSGESLIAITKLEKTVAELEIKIKESKNQKKHDNIELISVMVTAYNPVKAQTDNTPMTTASNKKVKEGMIALSRDLEKEFGFKFGDEIFLLGLGKFIFEDRMNKRWKRRVDILMMSKKKARGFGIQCSFLVIVQ